MYGGVGCDSLLGEGDTDYLFGKEGNDFLDGGEDSDRLNGNEGKDLLAIASEATITITDFTDGQDLLQLSESLSFDDLTIAQGSGENSADTLISLNSNNEPIAVFSGVSAELIATEDFVTSS